MSPVANSLTPRQHKFVSLIRFFLRGVTVFGPRNVLDDDGNDTGEIDTSFSRHSCESCGCHLGGDRTVMTCRLNATGDLLDIRVCTDCLMYHVNGDVPEDEYLDWLNIDERGDE